MNKQQVNSYKSSTVNTATPGQLVLMLFDGALKFMTMAEAGMQMQDFRQRNEVVNNNLIKAQNILSELQSSLDLKVPGDFAKTMFALYDFMIRQLQEANIQKTSAPIAIVKTQLKSIRDAWEEMLKKLMQGQAADMNLAGIPGAGMPAATPAASLPNTEKGEKIGGGLNASA